MFSRPLKQQTIKITCSIWNCYNHGHWPINCKAMTGCSIYGISNWELDLFLQEQLGHSGDSVLYIYVTDIDECSEQQGLCGNGRCFNTPGSYRCRCNRGYVLSSGGQCTGTSCKKTWLNDKILEQLVFEKWISTMLFKCEGNGFNCNNFRPNYIFNNCKLLYDCLYKVWKHGRVETWVCILLFKI